MIKLIFLITIFAVLALIISCTPAYIPNTINTPLLTRKGEFQGALHSGLSGIDPQFAYAVSDKVGVMLNGSFMFRDRLDSMENNYHKHTFIEGGAGLYKAMGDHGRLEAFGGFGIGKVNAHFYNDYFSSYTQAGYHRFFIQPSIGATSGVFDGSFTPRMSLVYMNLKENSFKSVYDKSYVAFFEPVLTGRFGYKYVKFSTQIGISIPMSRIETVYYQYQPLIFAVGIHVTLGKYDIQEAAKAEN